MKVTINGNNFDKVSLILEIGEISFEKVNKILEFTNDLIGNGLTQLDKEVLALMKDGHNLMAVKTYKDKTGQGLKESKEYCDALRNKHVTK